MPLQILLLALAVFAQGTSEFLFAGLLPDIASETGVPLGTAGLLTSTFAIGMVIGAPLVAAFGRGAPPRPALIAFLTVFLAAHVIGALTTSFEVLLGTRIIAALAHAGFLALTLSIVRRIAPPQRIGRAVALILAGTTISLIIGVPGGALIGALLGWRAALWAVVLLCLAPLLGLAWLRVPARRDAPVALRTELRALRGGSVLATLGLAALMNAATFCGYTFLAPLVTESTGWPTAGISLVLGGFGLGALIGVQLAGRLVDTQARRLLLTAVPLLVASWGLTIAGAGNGIALLGAVLLTGALSFAVGGSLIALSVARAAAAPSMGGSYATAALNLGAVAGPVLGGYTIEGLGVLGPLGVSLGLSALGLLALLLGRRWLIPRG